MNEYTFDYVERNWLDAFCKTVLRNEAITYLSELAAAVTGKAAGHLAAGGNGQALYAG